MSQSHPDKAAAGVGFSTAQEANRVLDALPQHIALLDASGTILFVNRAWRTFAEENATQIERLCEGNNYLAACGGSSAEGTREGETFAVAVRAVLAGDLDEFALEYECSSSSRQRWFVAHVSRLPSAGALQAVVSHEEVTSLKKAEEEANRLAYFDALTGLPNRLLLEDRLRQALAHADRDGQQVAVLFLDLDRFKLINDTLGHAAGDQLLRAVTERLRSCVRRSDTVSRLGGDEFVVVLHPVLQPRDVNAVALKILEVLAAPYQIAGQEIVTTGSVGISFFPDDALEVALLLRNADMAMYRAKERGRNNVQYFTEQMNRQAARRLAIETGLRQALREGELKLFFQEQSGLHDGQVFGAEALLRWEHPERGLLLPVDFLDIAEETGLIVPLGYWVMRQACRQWRQWQDSGFPPLQLAINLSARELASPRLVKQLQQILDETGVAAQNLQLEFTETALANHGSGNIERLQQLKALGISLAIDDFGTGYSSIIHLKHLPIDRLKIDHTFVASAPKDADARAVIRTVIGIAHNLGLKVMAEGVETEAQRCLLQELECDEMQGWYCRLPIEVEAFAEVLRSRRRLVPG